MPKAIEDILNCNGRVSDNDILHYIACQLRALVALGGGSGSITEPAAWQEQAEIAFGSVPASYTAVYNIGGTEDLRFIEVYNRTDVDIKISFDNSTDHYYLKSGDTVSWEGAIFDDALSIKYVSAPSDGSVLISAYA